MDTSNKSSNQMRFFENHSGQKSGHKPDQKLEAYMQKLRERHKRWDRFLESISPENPVRIAGELLAEQLKHRDRHRIGTMALKGHGGSRDLDLER